MKTFLPFAAPDVDEAELSAIKEAVFSGWVTTGPKTKEFEARFAEAVGASHAVAVNSCTAAMHLALEAVGVERGDEVVTTPYTFAATAEVVRYFDARPVLVDVRPDDFSLDPEKLEVALTERTRAIIPVHIAGLPAELDAIYEIAAHYGLAVIEDAAHAFPCEYKGKVIGSVGRSWPQVRSATCFSFYATKTITTGEGGMITTHDDELAERCQIMSLHGISKDAWKRYAAEGSWYYEIIAPGYKYNMTDIAAAMGLVQLSKAERMWARRRAIAERYTEAFSGLPALEVPADRPDCRHAWHLYMLRLHLDRLRIDRGAFIEELKKRRIGASVHFIPLHVHPYYRETYGWKPEDFPVAYREYLREVSLPIYSRMSDEDVEEVISAVTDIVERFSR
ncbi:DegT/DnrJ/EryC1/StrS family aminotransferase [Deferrisoma palaeochoriense]